MDSRERRYVGATSRIADILSRSTEVYSRKGVSIGGYSSELSAKLGGESGIILERWGGGRSEATDQKRRPLLKSYERGGDSARIRRRGAKFKMA